MRAWKCTTGLLLTGAIAVAAVRPSGGPEALVEANRALYRGDSAGAARLAGSYLKLHPGSVDARVLLSRALMAQGKVQPAYAELERALRAAPRHPEALYYMGRLCLVLSQLEFQDLYALRPDSPRVHQLLAESSEQAGDTAKAEEEYKAALARDPDSAELNDALAELERRAFRFDDAMAHYSRALERAPRDAIALYGLGACLLYKQDPTRAAEFLRRAVAADPMSAVAHFALGDALLRIGDAAGAAEELRAAAAREPEMRQAYTLLARAFQKLGQTKEAEAALAKSEELARKERKVREELLAPGGDPAEAPPRE